MSEDALGRSADEEIVRAAKEDIATIRSAECAAAPSSDSRFLRMSNAETLEASRKRGFKLGTRGAWGLLRRRGEEGKRRCALPHSP